MPRKPARAEPTPTSLRALLAESERLRTLAAELTQRTINLDSRIWQAQARLRLLEEQQRRKTRKK